MLTTQSSDERSEMRHAFFSAMAALAAALVMSSVAVGQTARSPWVYYRLDTSVGDGGPAPKRDLSGTWAGPGSTDAIPRGAAADKPSLTPLGQQTMNQRKPIGRFGPAGTNDPTARYCDPLGFPLNFIYQNRAMSVSAMPNRVVFLLQFGGFWREVWTDGRPLPTKVGGDDRDSLDPTYMGYSVGRWEDD